MKKQLKALLLVAFFACTTLPAWSQASTQGKEFWVALLMANSPSGFSEDSFEPFIAISAKKQCQVTVSNPAQNWTQPVRTVQADSWLVINDIPNDKWYDKTWTANSASETVRNLGIKVEATEEVSVYAAIRMEFSYDATNVLPVTALGSEYIIQDYQAYNKEGESHAAMVILATEDNTTVEIRPSTATQKGKAAGSIITVNLKKGETYQVIGTDKQTLSGTRVTAYTTGNKSAPKKIAVFSGADFTQVPGGKSARDCLYEQAMPVEYWGTQFVVTRSMEKDANRIRITAQTNGTTISIDGVELSDILNEGETYEFEMSDNLATTDMASAISGAGRTAPPVLTGDAHYIETSCPVAVFGYDVSSDYRFSSTAKLGDPSMVWISPLQQRISKITFGACGTTGEEGHTNKHYVNIVCLTDDAPNVHLSSDQRADIPLDFQPVPGNPAYSFTRKFLVDTDGSNPDKIYTLSSPKGVVAHVYGSGFNESYAYSVGSAAVKQGVNVNGETFTDGYRSENKFCFGDSIEFDAKVGTDDITRVDWYFGDGTTEVYGPAQTKHAYTSPGWYDVTADLYGHQVCTNEDEMYIGRVSFSFLVYRPDTLMEVQPTNSCIKLEDYKKDPAYYDNLIANGEIDTIQENCYDDVVLNFVTYAAEKEEILDTLPGQDLVQGYNGLWYDRSTDVVDTLKDLYSGCNIYRKYYVKVITCLNLDVHNTPSAQHVCPGETFNVTYTKHKGNIDGDAIFRVAGYPDQTILMDDKVTDGSFTLPISDIKKPGYYSGKLYVTDMYCYDENNPEQQKVLEFPIDFAVYYPDSIFKFKFNNVLAMYKPGHGGNSGYEFSNYEWHLIRGVQDTVMAAGPEASILYLGQGVTFESGDVVYVVLTDKDGMTLPSCQQVIEDVKDFNPQPQNAPASKHLIDRRIVIKKGEQSYNIYGQRIQ